MYARFRKDPFFLQRYILRSTGLLTALLGVAIFLRGEGTWLAWLPVTLLFAHSSFRSVVLALAISSALFGIIGAGPSVALAALLLTAGIYAGIWSNVLIHNAAHNIIKPAYLNRIVGELSGFLLLSGFPGFAIIHMEHHRHADHDDFDPHPNIPGQGYWAYIDETRARLRSTFGRVYGEIWGKDPGHLRSFARVRPLMPLNRALRGALILALLGPAGFTFFFLPAHLAMQFVFAAINYYTHVRLRDGTVEIRNLDDRPFYWIINRGFAGAFYHRNHHRYPKLFNPRKAGPRA